MREHYVLATKQVPAAHMLEPKHRQESEMRTVHVNAIITGLAFAVIALADVAGSPASAGPIVPPGHYCMTWDIGGSDCSFTSYDQCLATAAGLDAECYGKTARDDREDSTFPSSRAHDSRAYDSRAQMR
jgi:hypothetical protein